MAHAGHWSWGNRWNKVIVLVALFVLGNLFTILLRLSKISIMYWAVSFTLVCSFRTKSSFSSWVFCWKLAANLFLLSQKNLSCSYILNSKRKWNSSSTFCSLQTWQSLDSSCSLGRPYLPVSILTCQIYHVGPSRVRVLPLAAGINVGGHYKSHFFLFIFSLSFFRLIANSPRSGYRRNSNFCMGS